MNEVEKCKVICRDNKRILDSIEVISILKIVEKLEKENEDIKRILYYSRAKIFLTDPDSRMIELIDKVLRNE